MEAHLAKAPRLGQLHPDPGCAGATPRLRSPQRRLAFAAGERVKVEPMSRMRKIISDNMVASKRTSAHVYTVFEIDMTHVAALRQKHKAAFEAAYGTKLSFMPFIMAAVAKALRAFPVVNASVDGDSIVYKQDINLGVAVSLDWGLLVPGDQERRSDEPGRSGPESQRPGRTSPHQTAQARRNPGRHLHHHQSWRLRRRLRPAHHQPAPGGHPGHRRHRQAPRGGHGSRTAPTPSPSGR